MYPNRRIFNERAVIGEFSYSLRGEIRTAQCKPLFARTPIFENAEASFLSAICPRLVSEIAMPGACMCIHLPASGLGDCDAG